MTAQSITIQVKFFASLRESLGTPQINLTIPFESTVEMLLQQIQHNYGRENLFTDTSHLRVAINQQLVELDRILRQDDEVAVFPQITGG